MCHLPKQMVLLLSNATQFTQLEHVLLLHGMLIFHFIQFPNVNYVAAKTYVIVFLHSNLKEKQIILSHKSCYQVRYLWMCESVND